jgi:glycosyltransferase involved in cell wall biosynthesis
MAYYNRLPLLIKTLESIQSHTIPYEIVIVDDASQVPLAYDDLKDFTNLNIKLINVKPDEKTWCNPCIPYNISFKEATGDIILIQNPECFHRTDIVGYCDDNIKENEYVSFSCYSLPSEAIPETHTLQNRVVVTDGDDGWYNHSQYRPVYFHFTAAIHKHKLDLVGGFDERFAHGIAYDDNALLYHILKNKISLRICDEMISLHQYHYSTIVRDQTYGERYNRNHLLFAELVNGRI